jgi:chromosome partitioning protein
MGVTISVVTTKGGAGKSTLTALLAGEFAHQGQAVRVLDADPQQTLAKWAVRCQRNKLMQPNITVTACTTEQKFHDEVNNEIAGVTLIDVQGAASNFLTVACLSSDLVLVPCIASEFDAAEAAKIPLFLKATAVKGRTATPYKIVMNHVDGIEVKTKAFQSVVFSLADQGLSMAETIVFRRSYYRQLAAGLGSLYLLTKKDDATLKAIANIRALATEVVSMLNVDGAAA